MDENKGKYIKYYRKKAGLTLEEAARMIGTTNATLSRYESNQITNIPSSTIEALAHAFKCRPADLMGWTVMEHTLNDFDNIRPIELKKFPLLGEIACGEPIWAEEDHETYYEASANIKADFCLVAKGDSMINARINDGDVVFIKKQSIVDNGDIAAVIIDNEATLKRWFYYPDKQKLVLNPENSKYPPLVYVGEELNTIRCLGKAVCFMSKL